MTLLNNKTKYPAENYREGTLTTDNPMRGAIDVYQAMGNRWVWVARWDGKACQYVDNNGQSVSFE